LTEQFEGSESVVARGSWCRLFEFDDVIFAGNCVKLKTEAANRFSGSSRGIFTQQL